MTFNLTQALQTNSRITPTRAPPTESVSGGAQKSADIPSWADEGERTELLDGEMFSDIEVLAATSENESQDNESIDENTLLFSTPLMAQPTRLEPKESRHTTLPEYDAASTAESRIPTPPTPNETPRQAQTPPQKHDATLNESVPPSVFADRAKDHREGQVQNSEESPASTLPRKTTNRSSKTSNASQSPRAPEIKSHSS